MFSLLAGSAPLARLAISGLAGEGDVVEVAAVGAAAAGLVVAEVDAQRGFAGGDGTDFRGDVVPLVQGQVPALVGGVQLVAVLVDGAEVAQRGAVAEDHVEGDTSAVGPVLRVDPVGERGVRVDGRGMGRGVEHLHVRVVGGASGCVAGVHQGRGAGVRGLLPHAAFRAGQAIPGIGVDVTDPAALPAAGVDRVGPVGIGLAGLETGAGEGCLGTGPQRGGGQADDGVGGAVVHVPLAV